METLELSLTAVSPRVPPRFEVGFAVPQKGIHSVWSAQGETFSIQPVWAGAYGSSISGGLPVYALLDGNDRNRLTVACDEAVRQVGFRCGLREEDCAVALRFVFFAVAGEPLESYKVVFRIDPREVFYGAAVGDAADWVASGHPVRPAPEGAFEPLYSTWYGFHQNLSAAAIEAECVRAADCGMGTLIVDDGWQTDDAGRGYAFCGDWEVSTNRFPDLAAHVRRVRETGLRYMMWIALPYVGERSAAFSRFEGRYLKRNAKSGVAVLDPRFPEVREHLASTCERCVRDWGLDGLKLDFIDAFAVSAGEDPAGRDGFAGRDIRSVPAATEALLREIVRRVDAVRPEALIEFRQGYVGPAIRRYGNMLRASDCPGDARANRIRTASLRLTSGATAVHSDMLEWRADDTPENAALQILGVLFSVVQYSMRLTDLPPDHLRMLRHWIGFTRDHRETLLRGEFRPLHPAAGYPVIEASSAAERIVAAYVGDVVVSVGGTRPSFVVNATGTDRVTVRNGAGPARVRTYDTFGTAVAERMLSTGTEDLAIPQAGYAVIDGGHGSSDD